MMLIRRNWPLECAGVVGPGQGVGRISDCPADRPSGLGLDDNPPYHWGGRRNRLGPVIRDAFHGFHIVVTIVIAIGDCMAEQHQGAYRVAKYGACGFIDMTHEVRVVDE